MWSRTRRRRVWVVGFYRFFQTSFILFSYNAALSWKWVSSLVGKSSNEIVSSLVFPLFLLSPLSIFLFPSYLLYILYPWRISFQLLFLKITCHSFFKIPPINLEGSSSYILIFLYLIRSLHKFSLFGLFFAIRWKKREKEGEKERKKQRKWEGGLQRRRKIERKRGKNILESNNSNLGGIKRSFMWIKKGRKFRVKFSHIATGWVRFELKHSFKDVICRI